MHLRNIHRYGYDFKKLAAALPDLEQYLIKTESEAATIDFGNPAAVLALNKALLKHHYKVSYWKLPKNSLYPPIPGRADYIHHIADLIGKGDHIGLDIGCGASAIYPILGNAIYDYKMVGSDVHEESVKQALDNTLKNDAITIRQQPDRGSIFKNVILDGELYDFTMCNPPFYESKEAADKAFLKKQRQLKLDSKQRNFGGESHELWCNGGEALFIKRMIKESVQFKEQVKWFTCLLSRKQHVPKALKLITKLGATYKTIAMNTGNKESRFIAWTFMDI